MATMYFAKVNVNGDIYDAYDDPDMIPHILNELLERDWQKSIVPEELEKTDKNNTLDRSIYKFIEIKKDREQQYVAGRLIVIFQEDVAYYDEDNDDLKHLPDKHRSEGIPFYFDITSELVAFVPTNRFKYQRFVRYFELLLNKVYGNGVTRGTFRVFLKNNSGELHRKIKSLKKVNKVEITLIPPNSNKSEFDDLFAGNADELKETRSTKFIQTLSAPFSKKGINIDSAFIQRCISGIQNGWGRLKMWGKDDKGTDKHIYSDEAAPSKKIVKTSARTTLEQFVADARVEVYDMTKDDSNHEK